MSSVRVKAFDDDLMIVNMSVWESLEALSYVFRSDHKDETLRANGPTPEAFTFRAPFPPPGQVTAATPELEGCAAE